ncbi:MAG: TIGR01777 family protein [Phycisphaerales bacterium]|nr:TIGR01777 family protein [Phycisphaerales bacterium]
MAVFEKRSTLGAPADALFGWHASPGAFERLAPPWETLRIIGRTGSIRDGDRLTFQLRKWPAWITWEAVHRGFVEGEQFVDEQLRGPFRRWVHTHRFERVDAGRSALVDHVDFEPPFAAITKSTVRRAIERMFRWRHERTRLDVERHQHFRDRPRLRVVIAGASGLVGTELAAFLTAGGHSVLRLVRGRARGADEIGWDPARGALDAAALEGTDAVVHLGGVTIAKRFTAAHKQAIRESRVESTALLARAIAGLSQRPRVFLCASAIGYYGNRVDEEVSERSAAGTGFLPDVCTEWEEAARPARDAGVRVANLRLGIVLAARGGALAAMMRPFRLGLGGVVGSGRQWMSWITLEDVIGAFHHVLMTDSVRGPVNVVAPNPVTNREFTKTLGRVLGRPTLAPAPAFAIRAILGEMGQALLLDGAHVRPDVLAGSGFASAFPSLEDGLRHELGRYR